jgi:predicted transcriptional regulator
MKYRSRTDLIAAILSSAAGEKGALLTRIMYTSFLSYPQIKEFLQFLLEHGLIEHNELNKVYKITAKGFQYLELYKQIDELVKKQ